MISSPPEGYWALAPVIAQLRRELLEAFPGVPAAAYGTIGDDRHKTRKSDHNPDQNRYVRAIDIPQFKHEGPPLAETAEWLRQVGATGSHRLRQGGYVIHNRRIASERSQWRWTTYTGDSAHTLYVHLSCSRLPHFYKLDQPWNVRRALL